MSGFRSMVQSLVQQGIQILGDLAETVTFTKTTAGLYDPVTGNTTKTSVTYTFPAVFGRFGQNEIDGKDVIATDAKLTVAFLDLPVEPQAQDSLIVKGRPWKVIRTVGSPGDSVWTIHIRVT